MLISATFAGLTTGRPLLVGVVFAIRPAEYWLISRVAAVGRLSVPQLARLLGVIVSVNAAMAVGQFAGIVPSINQFSPERGPALFNGPYGSPQLQQGASR